MPFDIILFVLNFLKYVLNLSLRKQKKSIIKPERVAVISNHALNGISGIGKTRIYLLMDIINMKYGINDALNVPLLLYEHDP